MILAAILTANFNGAFLGLSGFIVEYLIVAVFITVIFFGKRTGFAVFSFCSINVLVVGALFEYGLLSPSIDLTLYSTKFYSWFVVGVAFSLVVGLLILTSGEIGELLGVKIKELETANTNLKKANDEIKTLQGILPICSGCGKIRDSAGYWSQVEAYIESHTDVKFSHALCQSCSDKLYGDQEWYKKVSRDKCPN